MSESRTEWMCSACGLVIDYPPRDTVVCGRCGEGTMNAVWSGGGVSDDE